jgi:uncharacterized protein YjbJ (UPF0337 family)
MNEDNVTGAVRKTAGELQAEAGRAARDHGLEDRGMQADGIANQAAGAAREAVGDAKDMAGEAWDETKNEARRAADWVGDRVGPLAQRAGRPMDGAEVRDALGDMAVGAARFVRDRPLAALGIMTVIAFVMGRNSRDPYRKRGIWR